MSTKMIYIGSQPTVTTGSDITGNGPLSPAQVDQIHRNLQSAVDTLAASQTVAQSGSYTPSVTAITGSISLTSAAGRYTKRDDTVVLSVQFVVSSVSSPTGHIVVSLPFAGAVGCYPAVSVYATGLTSGARLTARLVSGNIFIYEDLSGTASTTAASRLKAASEIALNITYFV